MRRRLLCLLVMYAALYGCGDPGVSVADHKATTDDLYQMIGKLEEALRDLSNQLENTAASASSDSSDRLETLEWQLAQFESEIEEQTSVLLNLSIAIEALSERVLELESQEVERIMIAQMDETEPGTGGRRGMRIESVTLLPAGNSADPEIQQYRGQARALRDEIREIEMQIAELRRTPDPVWRYSDPERYRRRVDENRRKRDDLTRQKIGLERDARRLEGLADRLAREQSQPRHRITGWDGERTVVLETERDLSAVLSRTSIGTFISWMGRVVSQDQTSEVWSVTGIRLEDEPAGFTPR